MYLEGTTPQASAATKHRRRWVQRVEAHKGRSVEFAQYFATHPHAGWHAHAISALGECASYLLFHEYPRLDRSKLVGANFCKRHLLCGACALRRASKAAARLDAGVRELIELHPEWEPYYLVLTVKNRPDLSDGYRHLMGGWQVLRNRMNDAKQARRCANPEASKYAYALSSTFAGVRAGAWSFETTFNNVTGEWHPHLNLLLLSDRPMHRVKVSTEWRGITGDSFITHTQRLDFEEQRWAACEVMKYAMKFSALPFAQNVEAFESLSRRRLVATVGALRGLDLEPDPLDRPLDDESYIEHLYRYVGGRYVYKQAEAVC